jgi:excinuclease UvrABC ATPase subunit
MVPVPSHFSRWDSRGWCPACTGQREITALAESLVIGNRAATPDGDGFLTPEADAVMKGVRRNELKPLLRRLATEGLWDLSTPFGDLRPERRDLVLFGFWSRPGPGSFLKSASANPAEVGSWLRWDGLYRRVLDEADRSRHSEWVRRLKESVHRVRCPRCAGSGLQQFAEVLAVGEIPFSDWSVIDGSARRLNLLRGVSVHTPRQRETLMRILDCLAPLAKSRTSTARAAVVERAVLAFTTMEAVNPSLGARN